MFKAILNWFFPPRCVFCGELSYLKEKVCEKCKSILKINPIIQPVFEREAFVSYCISPFKYDGIVRDAIWKFKFENQKNYSKVFSNIIFETVKNNFNEKFDFVTFVPLSKKRTRERGYDQAESLAREISFKMNISCENIFSKIKDNKPQHTLSKELRYGNVNGAYILKNKAFIKGKKILLCDDVVTTGSTLKECVKILHKSDVNNVLCCTFAATIVN